MPNQQLTPTELLDHQIRQLANTIALQAEAIATNRVIGPRWAAVKRLSANADALAVITPDDRS